MGTGKILLIIAASLVGLCCIGGVISMAVGLGKSTPSTSGSTSGAGAVAAKHATVGQPARDGQLEFTVQKMECGKTQVGGQYANKAAQGQFCLVTVAVKNIGKEARTFSGSSQKAVGAGGVKYENDTSAEIYANTDTKTFLENINPGNQVTGLLVFDIAKDAKITSLELHDSPFSGGVTVDMG
jgi:hypothetical protein